MKLAIIGASGFVGSFVTAEALRRHHAVTAIVRDAARVPMHPELQVRALDVRDAAALSAALAGHDAVISAFSPGRSHSDVEAAHDEGARAIIEAVRLARAPRLIVVGGAGTLEVARGVRLLDTPEFPEAFRSTARGTARVLDRLRAVHDVDWVFVSPSALLQLGERTGAYRVGKDALLVDPAGRSRISTQDYALALIDEVESPRHRRERFTVGY